MPNFTAIDPAFHHGSAQTMPNLTVQVAKNTGHLDLAKIPKPALEVKLRFTIDLFQVDSLRSTRDLLDAALYAFLRLGQEPDLRLAA